MTTFPLTPADDNEFIAVYENEGSGGWVSPQQDRVTNAWSFNTYKLRNSQAETYTFEINGDPTGSYGDHAYFQGKVLVQNSAAGPSFHDLSMADDTHGSLSLALTPQDTSVYFIVAAMPEKFEEELRNRGIEELRNRGTEELRNRGTEEPRN